MKIDKDNINSIYSNINDLIDTYFAWDIRPSELKRYLKPNSRGLKRFIERNELSDIERIEKVINDVVEDRFAMEEDGVMTFESYNTETNTDFTIDKLFINLEKSDIKYEKILADYYNTSLGHIEEMDSKKHLYNVSGIQVNNDVIVFSKEDVNNISGDIRDIINNKISSQTINLGSLNFQVKISDIIDNEAFNDIVNRNLKEIITEIMEVEMFEFVAEYKGYFIFEK
jgi:hypothetical protein